MEGYQIKYTYTDESDGYQKNKTTIYHGNSKNCHKKIEKQFLQDYKNLKDIKIVWIKYI